MTSNGRESVVLISAAEYAAYLKLKKEGKHAYGGKVTEEFERDLSVRMEKHKAVLEGLAK